MKRYKKTLVILLLLAFSVVFSILFKWIQTGKPFSQETLLYGILIFFNIIIPLIIAYSIFRNYSKKSIRELKKRILASILLFALGLLTIQLIIIGLGVYLYFIINGHDTSGFFNHLITVEIPGALKQFAIWILIGSAAFFYFIWKRAIDNEQKLREDNLKYRYRNLKAQVNPHFLFNSLNTLTEIVHKDADRAEKYIHKLSGIYRYVIENEARELVPLADEIRFVEAFFKLHEEREKDKLKLEINIDNTNDLMIIPVSLQSLVENAIKHNVASRENPLKIKINKHGSKLVISNNINKKNKLDNSTISGLKNLEQRVKMIIGKKLEYFEENNIFVVKLPLKQV